MVIRQRPSARPSPVQPRSDDTRRHVGAGFGRRPYDQSQNFQRRNLPKQRHRHHQYPAHASWCSVELKRQPLPILAIPAFVFGGRGAMCLAVPSSKSVLLNSIRFSRYISSSVMASPGRWTHDSTWPASQWAGHFFLPVMHSELRRVVKKLQRAEPSRFANWASTVELPCPRFLIAPTIPLRWRGNFAEDDDGMGSQALSD